MALDLGTLRAGVQVDASSVPGALAGVRRRFHDFHAQQSRDSQAQGAGTGRAYASALTARVGSGLRGLAADARKHGSRAAAGLNETLGAGVGQVGGILARGSGDLLRFGAMGAAALGAAGAAAGAYGLKVASGNEQAEISFETMLGSGVKARRFLDDLQAFAAKTPFEFPELQTAASSLISAGVNADKVIPIMTTLGNVTSGMGTGSEGIQRATIALQQMQAAGRITGEDLNQLRDAGIPVFDLLAAATGKSKEEVVKLAQAGKLGKEELGQLMKALENGEGLERFSGLMDKQSQSLSGLWSSFKDVFGQGLARVVRRSFPVLKDGLETATIWSERLFGWLDQNKDALGDAFGTGLSIVRSFGRVAKAALGGLVTGLGDGTASAEDFAQWLEEHEGDILETFTRWVIGATEFGIGLARVLAGGLRGFGSLAKGVGDATVTVVEELGIWLAAGEKALGWLPGIGPKLKKARRQWDEYTEQVRNDTSTEDSANRAADALEQGLIPALEGSRDAAKRVAEQEVVKAKTRQAVAAATNAIEDLGTKSDGGRIRLRKFSDISKLAADEQRGFKSRLDAAKRGLADSVDAARRAGAGQKELTDTWKEGKRRLYDEFKQMGLSNKEAKKLADRYAGIPPKASTKVEQPNMPAALRDTKKLDDRINGLNDKTVTTTIKWRTNVDGYKTSFVGEYFGKRGGPSQHAHALAASVGPVVAQPHDDHDHGPGSDGGGPSVSRRVRAGVVGGFPRVGEAHGQISRYTARELTEYAGDALKKYIDTSANSGAPGGSVKTVPGRGWAAIQAAMRRHGSTTFNTYPGHHPSMERARDVYPHNWAAANAARALAGVWYVIYRMKIASKNHGNVWRQYRPTNFRGDWRHERHIHVARYESGTERARRGFGWTGEKQAELVLSPQLRHYSGNERVLNGSRTERALANLGRRALVSGDVHLHHTGKPRDAVAELMYELRQFELAGR